MNEDVAPGMNERAPTASPGISHPYRGTRCRHTPVCAACMCTARQRRTRCVCSGVHTGGQAHRPRAWSQRYSDRSESSNNVRRRHTSTQRDTPAGSQVNTHKAHRPGHTQTSTHSDTQPHPHRNVVQQRTHEHPHTGACLPTFRSVPLSRMVSMRS